MLNCFTCNSPLPERGLFCKKCGTQFKCKNCQDFLEPNADACVMCGEMVGSGNIKNNEPTSISQTMNTFEFKETRNERSAKAIFTDTSVDSLREALSLVVSSYPLGTIIKRQNPKIPPINDEAFSEREEPLFENIKNVTPKQIEKVGNETAQRVKRLFFMDEGKLTLEVQDLKASGPKDFGVRLVYLRLLYSKEVEGKEFILRDDINNTLKEVMGSLDPNIVNWVSTNNDLGLKEDGDKIYVRLKGDGYTKAIGVLEQVYDDELKGEFSPDRKPRNNKHSSKSENSEKSANTKTSKVTKANTSKGKSKEVEEWMKKWSELNLNIDLHSIAKKITSLEKAVLGIWVIYKATSGTVTTLTTSKLANFIKEQFVISVTRQNFDQILNKDVKDYLMRTPEGWKITPTGIKHAESLVSFSGLETKPKGKK